MESLLAPLATFKDQFTFIPSINNDKQLSSYLSIVVCGMGGSAICVSLLKTLFPELQVTLHNSYGLPAVYNKANTLFILNSYSGNTEEILESYDRAVKEEVSFAIISKGGELIRRAEVRGDIYIKLPETTLEPRFSIGYQLLSLLSLMNEHDKLTTLRDKVTLLDMKKVENKGKDLASYFTNKYPVIYTSSSLYSVAYLIKAAINEGAKVPAFVNQIPEANHNELQSYVTDSEHSEKDSFGFLFIKSTFDHVRISKRFTVMHDLLTEHGFSVQHYEANHTDILSIFETVLIGYYMATFMAINKKIDPYTTPLIAEFKKRMIQ